jgi:hypothetical protein
MFIVYGYPEALLVLFFLSFPQLVSVCLSALPKAKLVVAKRDSPRHLDFKKCVQNSETHFTYRKFQPLTYAPTAESHVGEIEGERTWRKFVLTGGGSGFPNCCVG